MKKLLLGLLLVSNVIFSQEYKLGKVTVEELTQKKCSIDTSASAAVLFKRGKVSFDYRYEEGFKVVNEVEYKIKIYKKEGLDYANQVIKFYSGTDANVSLRISDAVVYNLENGKIVKTKLKNENVFDEKINKFWSRKKINFPNIKEGAILEFSYRLEDKSFTRLIDWKFQQDIPVLYNELKTEIPEYFSYIPHYRGYLTPIFESTNRDRRFSGVQNGGYEFNCSEKKDTYILKNVEALKDESYVDNIDNYRASISFELSSIQFPRKTVENYSTDWETVCKRIYEMESFGGELNKQGYFEDEVKNLLNNVDGQSAKIFSILQFVKRRVKWNGYLDFYCHEGVKNAYKTGLGNVAEINLMLTSMLRYAGLEANPVLVSTKSNGVSLFPTRTAFNYVVCGVEVENDVVLLDATDNNSFLDVLPARVLNWFGRIVRKNGSSAEIEMFPDFISKEVTNLMMDIDESLKVIGKVRIQKNDYRAFEFRDDYGQMTTENYLEILESKLEGSLVSDYKVDNKSDITQPLIETFNVENKSQIEKIGDKLYVNPLMFFKLMDNPFKKEERMYPIYFNFPSSEKYQIVLNIPKGYMIESLPSELNLSMPDGSLKFNFNISASANSVQIVSSKIINSSFLSSDKYLELKSFFSEMIKKHTEKIVLKKA